MNQAIIIPISIAMDFSEQLIEEWESDSIIFGMPKKQGYISYDLDWNNIVPYC